MIFGSGSNSKMFSLPFMVLYWLKRKGKKWKERGSLSGLWVLWVGLGLGRIIVRVGLKSGGCPIEKAQASTQRAHKRKFFQTYRSSWKHDEE